MPHADIYTYNNISQSIHIEFFLIATFSTGYIITPVGGDKWLLL